MPHVALMSRPTPTRASVSPASQSDLAPYFPNGAVATPPDMIVSPVSHSPGNGQTNELVGPATAEWVTPRQSHEQGIGVPPFKQWARQFHAATFNLDTLAIMPQADQVGPINNLLINRPHKTGWSAPSYGEQYEQPVAQYGVGGIANLRDPATVAYALGWGYIG